VPDKWVLSWSRWVLFIEYTQLLVTSKLRRCVKRRCYA
jgi:hypothetical protein